MRPSAAYMRNGVLKGCAGSVAHCTASAMIPFATGRRLQGLAKLAKLSVSVRFMQLIAVFSLLLCSSTALVTAGRLASRPAVMLPLIRPFVQYHRRAMPPLSCQQPPELPSEDERGQIESAIDFSVSGFSIFFLPLILTFGLVISAPQRKARKEQKEVMAELDRGIAQRQRALPVK